MNLTSRLIAGILALLGFSGCHISINDDDGGMYMYGTPTARFEIKGRVTDRAGDPVKDIKMIVKSPGNSEYELGVGITNSFGYYSVDGIWPGGQSLNVVAEDIDGDKNGGEFATKDRMIRIESTDYVGGEGWNRGKVIKTADFTLAIKPQEGETE